MVHFFKRTVIILSLCMGAVVNAQTTPLLAAPEVAANAYLLIDVTANQILASKNIDAPIEPASLTKLMSAYVVFDALKAKTVSYTHLDVYKRQTHFHPSFRRKTESSRFTTVLSGFRLAPE